MAEDYGKPLSDAEWAELQRNQALLRGAVAKHGKEVIKQAMKDAIQLPPRKGDLNK